MEIFILLVILLLCFFAAALKGDTSTRRPATSQEIGERSIDRRPIVPPLLQHQTSPTTAGYNFTVSPLGFSYRLTHPAPHSTQHFRRWFPPEPFVQRQTRERDRQGANIIENWKKSIVGLVKLSDKNLTTAKRSFEIKDCRGAVQYAGTSLENISRALIHCYSGKPDNEQGQEEALRMLLCRLDEQRRLEFEAVVDDYGELITQIKSYVHSQLHGGKEAKKVMDSAKEIQIAFKQMLVDQFSVEIAELTEDTCPKCLSGDVSIWGFGPEKASSECNDCHFKWSESRT